MSRLVGALTRRRCFPVGIRLLSDAAAPAPATLTTPAFGGPKWYSINGFSKFSSAKDLELCLDDVRPLAMDPILDANMYPTGKWALLLPDSASVDQLQHRIQERMSTRVYLNALRDKQIDSLRTASKYGISSRCVRLRNVHRDIKEDELRFFLRDYALSSEPTCAFDAN